jgi:hypothetical protein
MVKLVFSADNWGEQSLEVILPELFSFTRNKNISMARAWETNDMITFLHLLVSQIAFNQLQALIQRAEGIILNGEKVTWQYTWGKIFSSSRAYKLIASHSPYH